MQAPVLVLSKWKFSRLPFFFWKSYLTFESTKSVVPRSDQNTKRESGRKAQLGNISAAKAVADIIRTTLGPRSMLKMLLDASGSLVLTNDGNAILREIDVRHPAAKSMIELSRTQDEEVGDGTTSVIILGKEEGPLLFFKKKNCLCHSWGVFTRWVCFPPLPLSWRDACCR